MPSRIASFVHMQGRGAPLPTSAFSMHLSRRFGSDSAFLSSEKEFGDDPYFSSGLGTAISNKRARSPRSRDDNKLYINELGGMCKEGRVEAGLNLFKAHIKDKLFSPVLYERVMYLLSLEKRVGEMLELLDYMKKAKIPIKNASYSLLTKTLASQNKVPQALELLRELQEADGHEPARIYNGLIVELAKVSGTLPVAYDIFDEMAAKSLLPSDEVVCSLLDGAAKAEDASLGERPFDLLLVLRDQHRWLTQASKSSLLKFIRSKHQARKWSVKEASIDSRTATCRACGEAFESLALSPENRTILRSSVKSFLDDQDRAFLDERFDPWLVSKHGKIDVVLDALNVGYWLTRTYTFLPVHKIASYFMRKGKNVLLIGRRHILDCANDDELPLINSYLERDLLFLTPNESRDDYYLLNATFHTDDETFLVSNDEMRDHYLYFPNPMTQQIFTRWQRGHQIFFDRVGARHNYHYVTHPPMTYQPEIKKHVDPLKKVTSWHIPVAHSHISLTNMRSQNLRALSFNPKDIEWLCLRSSHRL